MDKHKSFLNVTMKVDTDKAKDIDEEVEFEAIFQPKKLWVFR